jgi:hypothetical protein
MTPGERVNTIQAIANALKDSQWTDIDLTLQEFGFSWSDTWNGNDRRAYVVEMVKGESDEKVEALHSFLTGGEPVAVEQRKLPWNGPLLRLFGSHRAQDKDLIGQIKRHLALYAVDLFVAHQDITPSKEWIDELELALGSCDALAAFLTPDFRTSEWCDQEVGFAMRSRVLIVPVCLGEAPYGFMGRYQGLNAVKSNPAEIAESMFDILVSNPLTAGRMSEAIVTYTAEADSFARANQGSELLSRVTRLTPALLRRLEESIESNSQVRGAFKAPGRIRAIVAKHSSQQSE